MLVVAPSGDGDSVPVDRSIFRPSECRYLSGPQAIVTMLELQKAQDRLNGIDTAGFVSGYRGSPLGGLDFALWRARGDLEELNIRFVPGLNEELAVNAVWGTQQVGILGGGPHDGVFGLWYAKNPGLDRAADAIKHANFDGTHPRGGVLAVVGDDPAASSSSMPNQSEQAFIAAAIPFVYPADLREIVEFGLKGYALSRYCGLWVGMKLVADTVDSSGSVRLPEMPLAFASPNDVALPDGGLGPRWPNTRWQQDALLQNFKLPAAQGFARLNSFDRTDSLPPQKRLGLIAAGKAYRDLREALALLGLSDEAATSLGIGIRKIGLIWPLETIANGDFLRGFEEILVIEEKRGVIEPQLKEIAYSWPDSVRPRIIGKLGESAEPLVPPTGETNPAALAHLLVARLEALGGVPADLRRQFEIRLSMVAPEDRSGEDDAPLPMRLPHFCPGCPHSRSVRLPEGSIATAGIGCHSMAMWTRGSETLTITQMGGEGANWIGASPFTDRDHIFQNLGDGTYMHSGILAIRAAVAADVPITYKILVNGAVAMTGGQAVEGSPSPAEIAWQLHAEGVKPIYLVSGRSASPPDRSAVPPGTHLRDRDDLDAVLRDCRTHPGVSAIIFNQICATEKRREIRSGRWQAAEPLVVINDRVCEGCNDCSEKSRCVAIRGLDTPFGTKRRIDRSTCNTDLSCIDGYCPSFVTIETDRESAPKPLIPPPSDRLAAITDPAITPGDAPTAIIVAGVGGTGLVTIGAVLGRAAHHEGRQVSVLDNTGLARKGGEVSAHIRIGGRAETVSSARIPDRCAALLIAGDLASAAGANGAAKLGRTGHAIVLDDAVPMVQQALDPSTPLPVAAYRKRITAALAPGNATFIAADEIAEAALGETIYANMILLGVAFQRGHLPVGRAAVLSAIEDHGVAVEKNRTAFDWGRLYAADPEFVSGFLGLGEEAASAADSLDGLIGRYAAELVNYQDAAYADRYRKMVDRARMAETAALGAPGTYTETVARTAYRLMAYKDEYEVARLLSDASFIDPLRRDHGAQARLTFHLAPPFLARATTADGRRAKRRFGSWLLPVLRTIARARRLRGTRLDPFGYQAERRTERRLVGAYESLISEVSAVLSARSLDSATMLVGVFGDIRGFGPVKERALVTASDRFERCRAALNGAIEADGRKVQSIGTKLSRIFSEIRKTHRRAEGTTLEHDREKPAKLTASCS